MRERATYLDVINRHRQASEKRGPVRVRRDDPKRREKELDLGRHYEKCVAQYAGRFPSKARLKNYCARVARTIVTKHGPRPSASPPKGKPDMRRMPPRNPRTGRFLKRGSRAAGERRAHYRHDSRTGRSRYVRAGAPKAAKRAPAKRAPARRAAPKQTRRGYFRHDPRTGRRVHVKPHTVHQYRRPHGQEMYTPMYAPARRRPRHHGRAHAAPVLTVAGLSLFVTTAVVADTIADVVHRLIVTKSPTTDVKTLPAGYQIDNGVQLYNNDIVNAPPGWASIGAQLLLAILGFATGYVVKSAAWKFVWYGFGTGSTLHLSGQLVSGYLIAPMTKNTKFGQVEYQRELAVQANMAAANGGVSAVYIPAAGAFNAYAPQPATSGAPGNRVVRRVGAPAALPEGQPGSRVPVALASLATAAAAAAAKPAPQPATVGAPAPAPAAAAPAVESKVSEKIAEPYYHPLWASLLDQRAA